MTKDILSRFRGLVDRKRNRKLAVIIIDPDDEERDNQSISVIDGTTRWTRAKVAFYKMLSKKNLKQCGKAVGEQAIKGVMTALFSFVIRVLFGVKIQ